MSNNNSAGILRLKIDVTKLDKSAFFRGEKGTYADITVLLKDAPDQYGNDGMIVQDIGKDRRERGEKGAILGNARWAETRQAQPARQTRPATPPPADHDDGDEIPF